MTPYLFQAGQTTSVSDWEQATRQLPETAGYQTWLCLSEGACADLFWRHTDTNIGPVELYRLAHAVTEVNPPRVRVCVATGSIGYAGAASVMFPDVSALRSLARDVRSDARVDHGC